MISLRQYVKRRNGVPLGDNRSLPNMLRYSLGTGTFAEFWLYWNPIWGYYLARYIQRPLLKLLPPSVALILTFVVSGALHDLAISLVKQTVYVVFTPWFGVMALVIVLTQALKLSYSALPWLFRAIINSVLIGASLAAVLVVSQ